MPKANSVHSTPPTNTPTTRATNEHRAGPIPDDQAGKNIRDLVIRPRLELVQDEAFSLDVFHRRGSLRRAVENHIEMLIDFLDYIGSASEDEEPDDDEPSLGWTRSGALGDHRDLEINEVAI